MIKNRMFYLLRNVCRDAGRRILGRSYRCPWSCSRGMYRTLKQVLKRWKPFFGFPPFFRHSAVILFIFILFPLCVKFHISCASALDGSYSVLACTVRIPAHKLVSFPCRLCKLNRLGLHRVNGRVFAAVLSAI